MSLLTATVSKALIEELEKRFPLKRPLPAETYPEIMYNSGQLSVIEFIRASYEEQQHPEKAFKTPIK